MKNKLKHFLLLTASTLIMAVGVYFFKFANNFTFGGHDSGLGDQYRKPRDPAECKVICKSEKIDAYCHDQCAGS